VEKKGRGGGNSLERSAGGERRGKYLGERGKKKSLYAELEGTRKIKPVFTKNGGKDSVRKVIKKTASGGKRRPRKKK